MHDDQKPESLNRQGRCREADPLPRLLEYLDGRLSSEDTRLMGEHLAACEECTALARQWAALDAQLSAQLDSHPTSPEFIARVWRAVESIPLGTAARAPEQKSVTDSEWSVAWLQHRRRVFWTQLPHALDQAGYAFGIAMGVFFACRIATRFWSTWPHAIQTGAWQIFVGFGLGLSGLILVVALGYTAKRPLARLLASL